VTQKSRKKSPWSNLYFCPNFVKKIKYLNGPPLCFFTKISHNFPFFHQNFLFFQQICQIFIKNGNFLSIFSLKKSIFKNNFTCGSGFLLKNEKFHQKIFFEKMSNGGTSMILGSTQKLPPPRKIFLVTHCPNNFYFLYTYPIPSNYQKRPHINPISVLEISRLRTDIEIGFSYKGSGNKTFLGRQKMLSHLIQLEAPEGTEALEMPKIFLWLLRALWSF
jgi:hypothetical protein